MAQSNNDPQELADLIDSLMAGGSGHVNIIADNCSGNVTVDIVNSTDLCGNKGACCQPTEDAIDSEED